jgi:Protein of unknown function DUF262
MENEILEEYEDPAFNEDDNNETPPIDIVAYNELRSCADLARLEHEGTIDIMPDFQRDVVWTTSEQTRFVDSLIKQLPIPSMCFALDYKTDKWIVIDGLQRMSAIIKFLKGGDWRMSKLPDIDPRIAGKLAASMRDSKGDLRKLFDRVQNKTLPITVLRCDFSKKSHMEYLFTIFHRLNAGGSKLNNQEIRNCIYGGELNNLLKELDSDTNWRIINRMKPNEKYRYVKQELILRFFAYYDRLEKYNGQVGKFLNDYMHDNKNPKTDFTAGKRILFQRVMTLIKTNLFPDGPEERVPTAVSEALFVSTLMHLKKLILMLSRLSTRGFVNLQSSPAIKLQKACQKKTRRKGDLRQLMIFLVRNDSIFVH